MLIEQLVAKNGDSVLRVKGRLLASRFDPRKEATDWVARRLSFIDKVKTLIILGAGSGYHIFELMVRTRAEILVLEPSLDLFEVVQRLHTFDSSRVRFENVQSAKGLRATASVRQAVKESFRVLVHPSSRSGREKIFDELQAQLIARDWGSLTWQWKLQGLGDLAETLRVDAGKLTIYDLEQTELVQNSVERERLLIKALRELVK